jgi:hypothetical protein
MLYKHLEESHCAHKLDDYLSIPITPGRGGMCCNIYVEASVEPVD